MPGPTQVPVLVAAIGTVNVPALNTPGALPANADFTPGSLPQPTIDNVGIQNGQYFLLTDQTDPNTNGLWFADPSGPIAVYTFGKGNVNPNMTYQSGPGNPGSQNGNQLWGYTAQWRGTGSQAGFQQI